VGQQQLLHLANDSRYRACAWLGGEPPRECLQGGVVEGEHQVDQVAEHLGPVLGVDRFIRSAWWIHDEPATRNIP
jgi:hypothetical protein